MTFIVLDFNWLTKSKEGHKVLTVHVADRRGSVNLSLLDDLGLQIESCDIIRLTRGYVNVWKNCLTPYVLKNSEILKIGQFCFIFEETPFMR